MASQNILIDGGMVAALAWGNESSPARILCLHGWMDNAATFLLTAPRIAETLDARVVAIDFPGHGQSFHRSPGATYMFTDYILDTVRVLDALNWKEPVILLGHSMGGGIALMLAAAFPERVRAVISIDSVGVMTKPPKDAVESLRVFLKANTTSRGDRDTKVYPTVADAAQRRVESAARLPGGQSISYEAAHALVFRILAETPDGSGFVFIHDKRIMNPSPYYFTEAQLRKVMTSLLCPVLFVLAQDGLLKSVDRAFKYFDRMALVKSKPCRCVVLPGGHHLHADPDTAAPVQEAIATFLQAVVSSESSSPESQSSVVVKRLVIAVCVAATVGVARFFK